MHFLVMRWSICNVLLVKFMQFYAGFRSSAPVYKGEHVGVDVPTAESMKMAVIWVVAPCTCSLHQHRLDEGGSKNL